MPADFRIADHGSIVLLHPQTPEATAWQAQNLTDTETQTWGLATVIEPRYVAAIVDGIEADGLTIAGREPDAFADRDNHALDQQIARDNGAR